jgi:hypothetical protein
MTADSTGTAVLVSPQARENLAAAGFSPVADTAAREFQASLQLLAERARFLTAGSGVAIALKKEGQLVYLASAGDGAPAAGTTVDTGREPVRACLEQQKSIRRNPSSADCLFTMAVPIVRNGAITGFFELLGRSEFQDQDERSIERLADLVNTAVENRTAAVETEKRLLHRLSELARPAVMPSLWHAPESGSSQQPKTPEAPITIPEVEITRPEIPITTPQVQKCVSCGFPVSQGRRLCVECDHKMGPANPPIEIFSSNQHEQSWISVHGYTIASALLTALAIAIVLWLR